MTVVLTLRLGLREDSLGWGATILDAWFVFLKILAKCWTTNDN